MILASDARAEAVSCEYLPALCSHRPQPEPPRVLLSQVPAVTAASPALLTSDHYTLVEFGGGMYHLTSEVLD